MKINVLPNQIMLEGVFDENVSREDLSQAFQKLKSEGSDVVSVDFSKVSRANSTGIVIWLRFLNEMKIPIKYVNSPVWLVNQFNMISGFFDGGHYVESIQIPFYCESTDSARLFSAVIGKDIPLLKSYEDYEIGNREVDGKIYEPDVVVDQYLAFLAENHEAFSRCLNGAR